MDNLLKTPLYDLHQIYGGKMIGFAGWTLPVYYSSILEEHEAVRTRAGLFDVSHMGKIEVKGKDACGFLQRLTTGDVGMLVDGQAIYSLMCYPNGGAVDDILIYRLGLAHYYVVVNASNTSKDLQWMIQNKTDNVEIINVSRDTAQLALQGPLAEQILQGLTTVDLAALRFFRIQGDVNISGINCLVSRTGYTGEDGFEIYATPEQATALWEAILKVGSPVGAIPAGLGARDTLRLEAGFTLYGHELAADITPLEAGLDKFVKLDKADFIGREALAKQAAQGVARRIAGFEMEDRGIPRANYLVECGGREIGFVTSGGYSPTLKKNLGLAMLEAEYAEEGKRIDVIIRKKRQKAVIVRTPFLKRPHRNKGKEK
ncbi:MAG: glycine cleavage system aminomethyltransferase GcvT [Desulfotomaculaceae bacterium]|nr:glycine cleavage system aminomethyltransferase GcvT [Desulfotomaculaceae bacterium]